SDLSSAPLSERARASPIVMPTVRMAMSTATPAMIHGVLEGAGVPTAGSPFAGLSGTPRVVARQRPTRADDQRSGDDGRAAHACLDAVVGDALAIEDLHDLVPGRVTTSR